MPQGFLVFVENRDGKIKKGSLEAVSAARRLADALGRTVDAVIVGDDAAAAQAARYGAHRLFRVAPADAFASRDAVVALLEGLVRQESPAFVVASATAMGKDCLPALAARFERSVIQDATEAMVESGELLIRRPIYAGKAFEVIRPLGVTSFVTLRPNVFPAAAAAAPAEIVAHAETVDPQRVRTAVVEVREATGGKVELTEAAIVVSGGRGIKGPEHFPLIEELAAALGAAAGASRAVVDAGWVDHHHQVGQTGKTVSPTLYVAVGISGAIQHLAGMSSSKYIVAVNKDPDAPIFKVANYGIVGDLFKIVPLLTEEVKKLKA
jgi:electron transfer flavoprotein alpha subunit